ncbi:MAG: 4Fe-4S dicluster domain-containing protein [Oscillospiraceae bacterium]|nr:4Fe-4S dicluster domain-containing protein [Oscillospiraceae bacterium]
MQEAIIKRAKELLADGTVNRVVGWKAGDFAYDVTPAVFTSAEELDKDFLYNDFCAPNLSKYLIKESRKEGKVLVFLKPCDSYSFNQLLKEHRILRDNVYVIAIPCRGKVDIGTVRDSGIKGITDMECDGETLTIHTLYGDKTMSHADSLGDKCKTCKTKKHAACDDEMIGEEGEPNNDGKRFEMVEKLEAMTSEERFNFWRNELSKCIRCNACRNVCPACSCENCVFDNPASGIQQRAAVTSFEENMFHLIRAFHVAGRCTDCGECTRVCPQNIPLHLLNRKYIKDINEFYGEYQAGENFDERAPLNAYTFTDCEPDVVYKRGGNA